MTDDGYPDPPAAVPTLSPASLKRALDSGEAVRLLDVRDRDEVAAWHVDGPSVIRTHIPYAKFMQAKVQDTVADRAAEVEGSGPITVVCGHGEASAFVAGLLADAGVDARNLAGGMDEWARIYDAHGIAADGPTVVQYQRPATGCLAYRVQSDGEILVVDPLAAFTDRYVTDAEERDLSVTAVLDTHVHADHVSGLRDLAEATGARPLVPEGAAARGMAVDVETVADGDELSVGSATAEVVALPGHTTGMVGLAVGDVLLSGDSLFLHSVARPDVQGGTDPTDLARDLYRTLTDRLAQFPADAVLAPGHYDARATAAADGTFTAPLGAVRDRLQVFSKAADDFVARLTGDLPPGPANAERIVEINLGTEAVADEDAFELELGPNNCAAN